jgi:glycosyltransferase involved in cell wall biosynthesis
MTDPLRVHVLVDLRWNASAGGHVKVWERLAAAATELPSALDLTVHFSAPQADTHVVAPNVRYRLHPPVFSSARLPFLSHIPDHTDLAPHHPGLAEHLHGAQVLHTTDAFFAFARTAERIARRRRVPLVSSVHTDTPRYTALFTAATLQRILGPGGRAQRWLARSAGAHMERRLLEHQRRCAYALVSRPTELGRLARELSPERVGLLRRGLDHRLFSSARRDRHWLQAAFGVPPDRLVVLLVGRLDRGKNVGALVESVAALVEEGRPLFLLCAGDGPDRAGIRERLPRASACPGVIDLTTLAQVYASADLLAHPSEIEETSNVVLEALAAGLPVAAAASGAGRLLEDGRTGLVVPGGDGTAWTAALRRLVRDSGLRETLGRAGRAYAERAIPSWGTVLAQDLLPFWTRAARGDAQ